MMRDVAPGGTIGEIRGKGVPRWITFETDDHGRLLVRTLNGFKIIEDPEEAAAILKIITDAAGL